ncbi:MAG TPA: hypothetical protein PLI95_07135 [Polyangiaceae bacterium]|nr:hypothetical protein [Polyangiaceae bacterium]
MKPSAALLIGLAPKGAKESKAPEKDDELEGESADLELLGQELIDALAAKDGKRVCEAVVACMAAEATLAASDDDEEEDE